ncbi:hypothetical protein B0T26DRAFT_869337 [Lasiosphaeria miniovina]|uniref:Uncharacterized protein n=1 Tax=Lasiosphaeria miniovina TaxID=1954250 RepID=A0AA40B5S0_9PEZI|nr:uncharacterized protein B0T26DRAFT_869337 [Lasiosphaeria miniovina]KAK0728216.1 hypothetical protein B0T26DRAFT_869337 [Lasiosphaeria miniovina]
MAPLIDTFVSASTYNALPLVGAASQVRRDYWHDLRNLGELLYNHGITKDLFCIHVIHKHGDVAYDGEVMVLDKVDAHPGRDGDGSGGGTTAQKMAMKPVAIAAASSTTATTTSSLQRQQLRGIHYFVNSEARLQAYEYAAADADDDGGGALDMSGYANFLSEFCRVVSEHSLQHKFGLRLEDPKPKTTDDGDETDTAAGQIEFECGLCSTFRRSGYYDDSSQEMDDLSLGRHSSGGGSSRFGLGTGMVSIFG